jgi:hypothetical protein
MANTSTNPCKRGLTVAELVWRSVCTTDTAFRARQNSGGAADGDTLRIDIIQYPADNWECDAE